MRWHRSFGMVVLLVLLAVPYMSDAVSLEYLVDSSVAEATLLEGDIDDDKARGLAEVQRDIRMFKIVIPALAGLATIVGTWHPVQAEPLTVGAPPSLRPAF